MINQLMKIGESRITSAERRNFVEFERSARRSHIDRTETSFAGQSKMTMKQLKEATKRRREMAGKY